MMSPNAAPVVSVIMSMRNSASTVADAIHSVILQSLTDWEMIVIDDGSTDQSVSIVLAIEDDRIRLVRETPSAGLATRLNQAVVLTRGQFIARMDADDICFPERLARQVAYLQANPQIDLIGGGAVVFSDDMALVGELPIALTHSEITVRPFIGFPLPHPTWCGRAAWFRSHLYDSSLMKAQDLDLLLRNYRNSKFASLDTIVLAYRQNQLDLSKLLSGRKTYIGCLWRYGLQSGEFLSVGAGIATHVVKGVIDLATIGFGLNYHAQKYRLKALSSEVELEWRDLQLRLSAMKLTI